MTVPDRWAVATKTALTTLVLLGGSHLAGTLQFGMLAGPGAFTVLYGAMAPARYLGIKAVLADIGAGREQTGPARENRRLLYFALLESEEFARRTHADDPERVGPYREMGGALSHLGHLVLGLAWHPDTPAPARWLIAPSRPWPGFSPTRSARPGPGRVGHPRRRRRVAIRRHRLATRRGRPLLIPRLIRRRTPSAYSGGVNATPSPTPPDASARPDDTGRSGLSDLAAVTLVFFASAAVLVVELVALRLLAPHLGLTLETNTLVIGIALGAIALGSWAGGRAADVIDPRRALAPLLGASAVAVAATPSLVRAAAALGESSLLLLVAATTIIVPGALLSAVTPMVTKLSLTSLEVTGSVVGRLSSIGTAGSIVGTVVTGFVLISRVPVSGILVGLGVALLVAAMLVAFGLRRSERPSTPAVAGCAALVAIAGGVAAIVPDGCDVETSYHCAAVVADPENRTGRILMLDGLRHSYVDLADDENLHFRYVRSIAAAVDSRFAAGQALQAHHIGGGGLTMPRHLASTRPGTQSTVSEIDPGVIRIDQDVLGAQLGGDLQVNVEDGRLGLAGVPDGSRDLVVGDAFGGVSVPWHLTTRETVQEVARTLEPGGIYALNVIDRGPQDFARAEVATIAGEFDHVALASTPEALAGTGGGNFVVLASDSPLDSAAWKQAMDARQTGWDVMEGDRLRAWVGDSPVLTDDYAPVDQLLTPA